jgi:hypothetical protein
MIPHQIVSSLIGLQRPMNQKIFGPLLIAGKEVGEAYNSAVEMILAHAELSKFRYLLTSEEDNIIPGDGLIRLYESMDKYDAVGGLYWTKGEGGMPMIYGDPNVFPKAFNPQIPVPDVVQRCNGLGMGFTLFKISMFKKLPSPWFRTVQERGKAYSQDLFFFENAGREGYKFASDNRVKVGHLDPETGIVW